MIATINNIEHLAKSILTNDPRPIFMQEWQRDHKDKWIAARHYYKFLYTIAKVYPSEIMVELGTDKGYGAWHMAEGNSKGLVVAVDITLDRLEVKPKNVYHVCSDTVESMESVRQLIDNRLVDIILFDSTHSDKHASKEFELFDPICCSGCIQLFDDITESADMMNFWNSLPGSKALLNELHPTWGGRRTPGFGIRVKP